MPVEIGSIAGDVLRGDVELAPLRVDERGHGGQQDEGGEDGFIHLVPERVAMGALDAGVGESRQRQMRQGVGENRRHRAVHVAVAEQQINERGGEEDEPGQRVEIVDDAVEVAEPLREREATAEQRRVDAENLHHAARPADALADVVGHAGGGKARGLWNIDVGRAPAAALHAERGVGIFGDGFDGDAADLLQRRAADDGAGAAEEGGVPEVVAVLDDAVEE